MAEGVEGDRVWEGVSSSPPEEGFEDGDMPLDPRMYFFAFKMTDFGEI